MCARDLQLAPEFSNRQIPPFQLTLQQAYFFHPIGPSRLQSLWPDCKQKSSQWVNRSWHHPLIERHHYSSEGSTCYFLRSPVRFRWLPWGCQVNECHDNDDVINVFQFSSAIFYHVLCSLVMIMVKMIWLNLFFSLEIMKLSKSVFF